MQIQKEKIRLEILNKASQEFLKKGYTAASMRIIAKKAEISVSNVYNYFKSKEVLFYSLTDPVFHSMEKLFNTFIGFENGKDFADEHFLNDFIEITSRNIGEFIKKDRIGFLLIMDKSTGTRYEKIKDEMIESMEKHFFQHMMQENMKKDIPDDLIIMHLIAINFLEGLLEIARHYKNELWIEKNVKAFLHYHIGGMASFLS